MATGSVSSTPLPDTRLDEEAFPFWKSHFTPAERRAMIDDDLAAGRVTLILAGIVAAGVTLALLSVWMTR